MPPLPDQIQQRPGHPPSALKDGLGKLESALTARLARYERYALGQLDEEFRAFMQQLDTRFGNLERLAEVAFDQSVNASLRLQAALVHNSDRGR